MTKHKITKQPKQTLEILLTIPWEQIQKESLTAFDHIHEGLALEGFRKGKVPKELAKKHIPQDKVYEHMIQDILPHLYENVIKEENLQPITSPRIELVKAKENEDWEIKLTVAQKPEIDLGNYKEAVKKAKNAAKKADIWVPGKDAEQDAKAEEAQKQKAFQEGLNALLKEVKLEISDLIIQEEISNRLSRLVDDIQRLGISVESYLKSKDLTMEKLRENLAKEIEETYKMEFILQEIADKENIQVEKEEIEKLFGHIKDEKEKQAALQHAYYYASLLRKQKVLEYLNSL